MSVPTNDDALTPYRDVETAPFVHFDYIGAYGIMLGTIQIELAGHILAPNLAGNGASAELITVARLRCSRPAAENLQRAIGKALEMHDRVQQQPIASSGKLN
jgi:hypothetical protein